MEKGESECLFCLRKLKSNIVSLHSPSCQRDFINDKLMSLISPTDYKHLNDVTLFPKPKICTPCFNTINSIHRNAQKIESLTGKCVNFQLSCNSAVNGSLNKQCPNVKQLDGQKSKSNKSSLRIETESESTLATTGSPTKDLFEVGAQTNLNLKHLSPQMNPGSVNTINSKVQDSGEDTDNYYEATESMIDQGFKAEDEDSNKDAPSHKRVAAQKLSAQLSAAKMHDEAGIVNNNNHVENTLDVHTLKGNQMKREQPKVKRKTSHNHSRTSKHQHDVAPIVVKSERKSNEEEKKLVLSDGNKKNLIHICPFADCGKKFKRGRDMKIHITIHTGEKPYKCEVIGCQKDFRLRNPFTIHMRTHTGERPYQCQHSGCDRAFIRLKSLRLHETTHSSERPFCCEECGKQFKHIRYFKLHKKSHKRAQEGTAQLPDKSLPCEVCGKMFSSKVSVQRHVNLVHMGLKSEKPPDGKFICEVNGCNRAFRWKSCMVRHKALKHRQETYKNRGEDVKYTCDVENCKKEFNRRHLLREHKASVHGKVSEDGNPKTYKEWLCPDCGLAVIKIQMNRHRETYHSPGSVFNSKAKGAFVCMTELCRMTFDNAEELRAHIPMHYDNRPYTCPKADCGKAFLLKKNFDVHTMLHDDIKPFECQVDGCGKRFVTQLCLMRHSKKHNGGIYKCPVETCGAKFRNMNSAGGHLAVHKGEDPYICGLCGAVFSSYNVWFRHKNSHSRVPGQKLFKCPKCSKSFEHKHHLTRHLSTHSDVKPYSCDVCGMSYASKVGLRSHKLTHEEKKHICNFEGCGKKFTLPLTLKRHRATHENWSRLCSSCGKIIKVSLKKHKCVVRKQDGPTHTDVQGGQQQNEESIQHQIPNQFPYLMTPSRELQELEICAQTPQQHNECHDHNLRTLCVSQEGKNVIVPQQMLEQQIVSKQQNQIQQQLLQPQQHHRQQQLQEHYQLPLLEQERQHGPLSFISFRNELQLSNQQIMHPLEMSQSHQPEISHNIAPTTANGNVDNTSNIVGTITSNNIELGGNESHLINTPSANTPFSNFNIGANVTHTNIYTFPSLQLPPSSTSSDPITTFPASSMPSTLIPADIPPLTSFTSQAASLPIMPINNHNNSFTVSSEALSAAQENILTLTPFPTANIPP